MKLSIEALRGVWRAQSESRTYFDETLEGLLVQLCPDAPEEYLWHTAEVLGSILGAEAVEIPQMTEVDFAALAEAVFGSQDEPEHWEIGPELLAQAIADEEGETLKDVEFRWQPTEAQQAYFKPPQTAPELEDAREVDAGAEGV